MTIKVTENNEAVFQMASYIGLTYAKLISADQLLKTED